MEWEYAELTINKDAEYELNGVEIKRFDCYVYNLIEALNEVGKDGWELVIQNKKGEYILKR